MVLRDYGTKMKSDLVPILQEPLDYYVGKNQEYCHNVK